MSLQRSLGAGRSTRLRLPPRLGRPVPAAGRHWGDTMGRRPGRTSGCVKVLGRFAERLGWLVLSSRRPDETDVRLRGTQSCRKGFG